MDIGKDSCPSGTCPAEGPTVKSFHCLSLAQTRLEERDGFSSPEENRDTFHLEEKIKLEKLIATAIQIN